MVEEIKLNIYLTLEIDSGLNIKDLKEYIENNLKLKPHLFIDIISKHIQIKNNK
jgi:hypothetical protein